MNKNTTASLSFWRRVITRVDKPNYVHLCLVIKGINLDNMF